MRFNEFSDLRAEAYCGFKSFTSLNISFSICETHIIKSVLSIE